MQRWILIPLALSAIALLGVLGLLMATEKRVAAAAPDYRVVRTGGVEYEAMLGRPIHPKNAVDGRIVADLSADDRRPRPDTLLYGAFISATNDSSRPLRTAQRIDLRDESGHVYRPISLPVSNAYAYRPRVLRPGSRVPSVGSPADANLAATGLLLLFRVPEQASQGVLELVIHDPFHPAETVTVRI